MTAERISQKPNTSFNKGLITERNELTFPEGASVDELNCSLERAGNRRRRLGLQYEENFSLSQGTFANATLFSTGTWENVGNEASVEYTVVQANHRLFFYQKGLAPLSGNPVPISNTDEDYFSVNLKSFQHPLSKGAETAKVQLSSVKGLLIVVSPEINAFYVEKNLEDNSFSTHLINFKVRDFSWQGDIENYYTAIPKDDTSPDRLYDTKNAGWTEDPLASYNTATSNDPALNLPWFSGKDSDGNFSPTEWAKIDGGTSLISNGKFFYDLFNINRSIHQEGAQDTVEVTRFSTITSFSGRIFYAGLNSSLNSTRLYFSQLIETPKTLGWCYQTNDPTSEASSDLLATDGGDIVIPEAYGIRRLHTWGDALYVFAANGVWMIRGVDGVFKATEYIVDKITSVGINSPESFVSAEGRPYWWSTLGIHTIIQDQVGKPREENLSINSIQTFWDNINKASHANCKGDFDRVNKRVVWMYSDDSRQKYNNILFLDEALGAFYPWRISDKGSNTSFVIGSSYYDGIGSTKQDLIVVDDNGDTVVDDEGNVVVVMSEQIATSDSEVRFLTIDSGGKITFSRFIDKEFLDWGEADYSSFAEAGYDFAGDMTTKKTAPYIFSYFRTTEEGYTGNPDQGYEFIRPSSCNISCYWDFKNTPSTTQEAYRLKGLVLPDEDTLTFDYNSTVVTSKIKVRGRGRSMKLRFESTPRKDFNLLGWAIVYGGSGRF